MRAGPAERGVSVALDETAREVNERQVPPARARARDSSSAAVNGPTTNVLPFERCSQPNFDGCDGAPGEPPVLRLCS